MKKIFGIMLALALVLSLSLVTVTSVVADVHAVEVAVLENTITTEAQYTIAFNTTKTLAIGATVSIEFPPDTTVPTTYETGDVAVEGQDISQGDIAVDGQVVTITLPAGIGAPTKVAVVFKETAGITNPTTQGDYTLRVRTSQEPNWVTSASYPIRLLDKSTYEFVYQMPEMIWVGEAAGVDLTLQTKVAGVEGYDDVEIAFEKEGPGNVEFEVWNGAAWDSFSNLGTWSVGSLAAVYTETTPFRLTFDKVGVYTITFELWDLGYGLLVTDDATAVVTGVSIDVTLNKGWNLISLPIVPDDSAIGAVLADVMDDVISVHQYRVSIGDWLIYAPPDFTTLTTIEDGKAYWINMANARTLTVIGQAIAPPGYGPPPSAYGVVEGWNMLGFKSMEPIHAGVYLEGTEWVRIYGFDLAQGGWFPLVATDNMTPGLGYWVAFSQAGTIYP
ncbi:MAG: hypothetical protein E3J42_06910 [Dehalococcoidia bacterium]|nr:MAG: hypothetical protein E3J42_06910 [Dehalococcoidia bacterium]